MKKLLFWKGRGTRNVLDTFLSAMCADYEIVLFPFEYDKGEPPFFSDSEWHRWLNDNPCDVWCGISLGASMMYAIAATNRRVCPNEMTLINPFISRSQLSREQNFSMDKQWKLELRNQILTIAECNMVISVRDEKIGMHHGIELINQTIARNKRLILIESDHCISDPKIQIRLSNLFSGKECCYDKIHQYRYIH